jgi:hypothetical protein
VLIGVTLILLCGQSAAGDGVTSGPITLASLDMPSSTSIRRSTDGTRLLFAARRTGEPKYDPSYFKFYFLDKKTNLLKRVLDDADENAHEASTDAVCRIAAFTLYHSEPDMLPPRRLIFTVNLDTFEKKVLVKDGNDNYSPSVSPDGRYVAFRADDGNIGLEKKTPLPHDTGKVVNVETGEIRTYCDPWLAIDSGCHQYDPPEWIDNDRVFFYCLSRDTPVHDERGRILTPPGRYGVIVVAIPKENRAVVKYYSGASMFRCVPDRERNTIWFRCSKMIVRSDWDLTQFQTAYQSPDGLLVADHKVENGEVVFIERRGKPWKVEKGNSFRVRITPDKGIIKEEIPERQ